MKTKKFKIRTINTIQEVDGTLFKEDERLFYFKKNLGGYQLVDTLTGLWICSTNKLKDLPQKYASIKEAYEKVIMGNEYQKRIEEFNKLKGEFENGNKSI